MERHYKKIFVATVIIKLILAYFIPITSDEAYFLTWGENLDVNYYDHPPMVGWIVYLFSLLGNHISFSRLFPIICGIIVAIAIYLIVRDVFKDETKARLIALIYLAAPLNILFVLISTDTPLFLFVFLSGVFFYYGINLKNSVSLLVSGIFLGLALLSKYFAGLLLIAFACYLILRRNRDAIKNGLILVSGAAPFVLLHFYWSYNNCWTNLMFNVFSRNKSQSLGLGTFFSFLGFQVYLATPWLLYYLAKNTKRIKAGIRRDNNLFFHLSFIPICILGILSFFDASLHWSISFYPFLFLLLVYLEGAHLLKIIKYSAIFSLIHVIIIVAALSLPVETFKKHEYYRDIVMGFYGDEIYENLKKHNSKYVLGTPGYTTAALMTYHSDQRFIVFMDYDRNGRNDDKVTDFRSLDGRNILILSTLKVKERQHGEYKDYFERVAVDTINVRGYDYTIVLGEGFKYEKYRNGYLTKILQDCYDIPKLLPVGDCFFCDRYFPEQD
ncbi:MAG: glycosyltransferase family 39 protein [Desulfobacterales bacterium]|nr:glycosyltransferase family 39 protein [Desulfobacterales bacterium]